MDDELLLWECEHDTVGLPQFAQGACSSATFSWKVTWLSHDCKCIFRKYDKNNCDVHKIQ